METDRTRRAQIFDATYGEWNNAAFMAWISTNITDYCNEHNTDINRFASSEANLDGAFDDWLATRYEVDA